MTLVATKSIVMQPTHRKPSNVGRNLRELRKTKGLSQGALGAQTTMGRSWPGLVERGIIQSPSSHALSEVARVLDVDPGLLLRPIPKRTRASLKVAEQ
jgi:transcriptional regulator with XRE-family HTH domain